MWLGESEFLKALQFKFSKESFWESSCWGILEMILPGTTQRSYSNQAMFRSRGIIILASAVSTGCQHSVPIQEVVRSSCAVYLEFVSCYKPEINVCFYTNNNFSLTLSRGCIQNRILHWFSISMYCILLMIWLIKYAITSRLFTR